MKAWRGTGESGFSLVELMVAMMITLIVTGAIYGLIAAGNTAFRREPELADRQQNIRIAMNLIEQDIINGGAGLPATVQVFTITDPAGWALNGAGPQGTLGTTVAAARNGGDSDNTDVIEIVGVSESCPAQTVCSTAVAAGAAGLFLTRERIPACLTVPGLVLLTDNAEFRIQAAVAAAGNPCPLGAAVPAGDAAQNGNLTLTTVGLAPWTTGALLPVQPWPQNPVVFLYAPHLVRYLIGPSSTDAAEPALWRSSTGRYATDGTVAPMPTAPGFVAAGSPWQMVARGIEDLQVEYQDGLGAWTNAPPALNAADLNTVVREVRVTLSARSLAPNLQGATNPGTGSTAPMAVRGQLTRLVSPRGSLTALQVRTAFQ